MKHYSALTVTLCVLYFTRMAMYITGIAVAGWYSAATLGFALTILWFADATTTKRGIARRIRREKAKGAGR